MNSCTWRRTAGQLEETQADGQLRLRRSFHTALPLVYIRAPFKPLSPCESPDFYLHYFTPLCVLKVGLGAII